ARPSDIVRGDAGLHRRGQADRRRRLVDAGPPGAPGASRSRRRLYCRCHGDRAAGAGQRAALGQEAGRARAGMARMRTASVTGAVVAAAFGLALIVSAQAPDSAPQLKILSPGEDSYVSGPTLLRASIVPAEAAASMTF